MHHILSQEGTTDSYICEYWDNNIGNFNSVTPENLITNIWSAVTALKLDKAGINYDLVGVHSLRAGGSMLLKLQDESDTTIIKLS